jgi:hypothetical protein
MTPFTGYTVSAGEEFPMDADPTTDARSQDNAENNVAMTPRTVCGL